MKIIAGNSNLPLAEEVAAHCFASLVPAEIKAFADSTIMIAIEGFVLEHWEQLEYLQDKQD